MPEKFIGFFRLVDACATPGCPVCRCLLADSRQYLEALLYEQVNDPDTRRRLRAAWGLCGWHTWLLGDLAGSAFGSAIIYDDMLRVASRRFEREDRGAGRDPAGPWRGLLRLLGRHRRAPAVEHHDRRAMCPACRERIDAETRYLDVMLGFMEDVELESAYRRSDGLCVPHTLQAVERGPTRPAEVLLARTLPKWDSLRRDLSAFLEKHDHRNPRPFTDTDRTVVARASEALAGAPGLFGGEARGTIRARPAGRRTPSCESP